MNKTHCPQGHELRLLCKWTFYCPDANRRAEGFKNAQIRLCPTCIEPYFERDCIIKENMKTKEKLNRLMKLKVIKHRALSPTCGNMQKEEAVVLFREACTEIGKIFKEICDGRP